MAPPVLLPVVPISDHITVTRCVPLPGMGKTKSKVWAASVVTRSSKLQPGAGAPLTSESTNAQTWMPTSAVALSMVVVSLVFVKSPVSSDGRISSVVR